MNYSALKHAAPAVMLVLSGVLSIGCGGNKDQERVASLPELPQADVAKLKPVPNSHLLASSELQRAPDVVTGPPPPPCAKDASITDFAAEVKYPITVCSSIFVDPGDLAGVFSERRAPTHKLDVSKLPPDLQAIASNQSQSAGRPNNIFWSCRTDDGPWQAHLTVERGCIGSCRSLNTLQLINVPNLVLWQWFGSPQDHPADFQFVGPLTSQGTTDEGSCHH